MRVHPTGVWQILEQARTTSSSVHTVFRIRRDDPLLQGASPSSGVCWINKLLAMYRRKRTLCFSTVEHWNLVGDASTHDKKETFVAVLWSWMNCASAYGDVQRLWPLQYMLPDEQDLPDEVATALAKGKQEGMSALRQLQAT